MELEKKIRSIPNHPIQGVTFRDITTLLKDGDALREAVDQMYEKTKDLDYDLVLGIEARGFILGAALAYKKACGFIPVRKPGKLPSDKLTKEYSLEYGNDALEMHKDAIKPGQKILIVDDLLATGGTAGAVKELVEEAGGKPVGFCFLIELDDLGGREDCHPYSVVSLIHFHEDE